MAQVCPASHTLPWVADEGSVHAARGTGIGAALERVPQVGIDAAVAGLPEEWQRVARAVADTPYIAPLLAPGAAALELAMEWDHVTDTARALGTGRESYDKAAPGTIVGTADLLAVTDDRIVCIDFKAGALAVPHPTRNMQLRFLALAAARAFNRDAATVAIAYCRDGEDAHVVSDEMDCLDLETAGDELRAIIAAVAAVDHGAAETYKRGEWCQWCPAKMSCPAWVGLVRWVTKDVAALQGQVGQAVSMGAIAAAYQMVLDAKKALGLLEAEIKRMAYGTPLPLGEGRYLALALGNERVVDPEAVHHVLVRETTPEIAAAAVTAKVTCTATKGSIEAALKPLPKKERGRAMDALRKSGALGRKADVRECQAEDVVAPPAQEAP